MPGCKACVNPLGRVGLISPSRPRGLPARSSQARHPPSLRNACSAWTLARPGLGSARTQTGSRPPQAYSRWGSRHPRPLRFRVWAAVMREVVGAQERLSEESQGRPRHPHAEQRGQKCILPCPRPSAVQDTGNQQNTSPASPPRCDQKPGLPVHSPQPAVSLTHGTV